MASQDETSTTISFSLLPTSKIDFLKWQSTFRSQVSQAEGFSSLEILSPAKSQDSVWIFNLRFLTSQNLASWLQSATYKNLLQELVDQKIISNLHAVQKQAPPLAQNGITEVYVTAVKSENLGKFHAWHEKIHKIESTFPGFQKVYIQAPNQAQEEGSWITLLQFDTLENLEGWLNSPERAAVLKESQEFVSSKESHRLLASFGGWFSDRSLSGEPPRWKQTMLILAVLYPIVMTQFIYLTPHFSSLSLSLKTFIDNVICVSIMSWILLPIAIYALKWWLESNNDILKNLMGVFVLLIVYALEVTLFWQLSSH